MSFNNFILGGAPIASMPLSFTVAETYSQILEASRNQATSWWVNNRPLDIFIPPIDPSIGLQRKREFKILEASFGDGYSQLSANSTQYMREVLELSWDVLTPAQSAAITTFLENKAGILDEIEGHARASEFDAAERATRAFLARQRYQLF